MTFKSDIALIARNYNDRCGWFLRVLLFLTALTTSGWPKLEFDHGKHRQRRSKEEGLRNVFGFLILRFIFKGT